MQITQGQKLIYKTEVFGYECVPVQLSKDHGVWKIMKRRKGRKKATEGMRGSPLACLLLIHKILIAAVIDCKFEIFI